MFKYGNNLFKVEQGITNNYYPLKIHYILESPKKQSIQANIFKQILRGCLFYASLKPDPHGLYKMPQIRSRKFTGLYAFWNSLYKILKKE